MDKVYSESFVYRHPGEPMEVKSREDYKKMVTKYRTAFPDIHFTVDDIVVEGGKIAARWSFTGTHKGALDDIPATGRNVAVTGISMVGTSGTRIVAEYVNSDSLGFMTQLGAVQLKK